MQERARFFVLREQASDQVLLTLGHRYGTSRK